MKIRRRKKKHAPAPIFFQDLLLMCMGMKSMFQAPNVFLEHSGFGKLSCP